MKTSFRELKLRAKQALLGNYTTVAGAFVAVALLMLPLILFLILLLFGFSLAGSFLSENRYVNSLGFLVVYFCTLLLELCILPGMNRLYLNLCKREPSSVLDIFYGFRHNFGKFFLVALAISLVLTALQVPLQILAQALSLPSIYDRLSVEFYGIFLCLYVLMILLVYLYIALNFPWFYLILVENPEKSISEALGESRNLMRGHKRHYVRLWLSFIAWFLLGYMTLGIGFFWLIPYYSCTYIQFYWDLRQQANLLEQSNS
ncbi:MAG: DUF975 family protein [Hungatella sp.]